MNLQEVQEEYERLQKIYGRDIDRHFDEYTTKLFPYLLKFLKQHPKTQELRLGQTDLLFLFIGHSQEPCLLVSCLLEPKKLILIYSEDTEESADELESAIEDAFLSVVGSEPPKVDFLYVHPPDSRSAHDAVEDKWNELKPFYPDVDRVAIDLTFGKKTMSIGGLLALARAGVRRNYYLDTDQYDERTRKPMAGTNFYCEFVPGNLLDEVIPYLD